jgi:hypothetical protein
MRSFAGPFAVALFLAVARPALAQSQSAEITGEAIPPIPAHWLAETPAGHGAGLPRSARGLRERARARDRLLGAGSHRQACRACRARRRGYRARVLEVA